MKTVPSLVRMLLLACVAVVLTVTHPSFAEEVPVPMGLQAELLAKVAGYDKNMPARAGDKLRIFLLEKPGNPDSSRAVAQMQSALAQIGLIAGVPHEQLVVRYGGAEALASAIRAQHAAIVFLSPGFADDIEPIRHALEGVNVLSAAAVPDYVARGIVLGFDLVSSKPKLLVHLTQAKKQNVAFTAEVLKLMRVYE